MSTLADWLFAKSPNEADPAPQAPAHLIQSGHLPGDDEQADSGQDLDPITEPEILEPVFALMDYRDAKGGYTRRRITMLTLAPGPNAPILKAVCHERRAQRSFRCDRIEGFIEDTGEVLTCADFFTEFLGIDLSRMRPREAVATADSKATEARDKLRPALALLVALARSDEHYLPEELNAICNFVEDVMPEINDPAHPGEVSALPKLRQLISRMRPTQQSLDGFLAALQPNLADPRFHASFEAAVNNVLWADGKIAPGEKHLLDSLGFDGAVRV